jgi:hypothetical protein
VCSSDLEHNDLVASIIWAARRGDKFIKNTSDTLFDLPLCSAQSLVKEKDAEEKRLSASIQKVKDELSLMTNSSESEPDDGKEEEDAEDDHGMPDVDLRGPREKSGKDPKWAQSLKTKKQKAEELRKRKRRLGPRRASDAPSCAPVCQLTLATPWGKRRAGSVQRKRSPSDTRARTPPLGTMLGMGEVAVIGSKMPYVARKRIDWLADPKVTT